MNEKIKDLIKERMIELTNIALKTKNEKLAKRYIDIVIHYKNKNKVKIPNEIKNSFCKKCHIPWIPGKTVKIRKMKGYILYICLKCGYKKRITTKSLKKG